ncbi:MAG TPA: DNA polymerase III subunit delta', partial [Novosphingobium sp.]|nr:DNA polymerase III subunit delta' [Novosphingobium sp.]
MNGLIGHEQAWREWDEALGSARMHHAWLLAGPKGLGKGLFAQASAACLVAEPGLTQPDPEHHPDIIVLDHLPANETEEEKKAEGKPYQTRRNITIEQVRRMQHRLTTRPTLGSRRAVIIDPADDLEKNA